MLHVHTPAHQVRQCHRGHFSAIIIGLSTLAICIQVITRYFGVTLGLFEEGPRLFFCFAVLPMLGVLLKRGRHINVEFIPNLLQGKAQFTLLAAIDLAVIAGSIFLLAAGVSGTSVLYNSEMRVVGVLDLPQYLLMLSVPIGAVILLFYSIESMVLHFVNYFKKGKPLNEEVKPLGEDQTSMALKM